MRRSIRFLLGAAAVLAIATAAHADQILGPGRINNSGSVLLPGGPTLGLWQGGKFTATPDALQIQGPGSTGPIDGMSVTIPGPNSSFPLAALFSGRSVTPQMWGATGTGAGDDTAALASALSSGRPVECHGSFKITSPVIVNAPLGQSTGLRGHGRQGCKILLSGTGRLQFNGAIQTTGTDLNRDNTLPQIVLNDISIVPTSVLQDGASNYAVSAISVVFPSAAAGNIGGWTTSMLSVRNVVVAADNSNTAYTRHGLYLENVQSPLVEEFTCVGARSLFYSPSSTCITYTGDGLPVDAGFRHIRAYDVETGISISGTWQGVVVDDLVAVNAANGVDAMSTDNNSLLLKIINSELNVANFPVRATNITHVMVYDNHLNLNGAANGISPACVSIAMIGAATPRFDIHDNICEGFQRSVASGNKRYGALVNTPVGLTAQHTNGMIHHNQFSQVDVGVYLGGNVNSVDVGCNIYVADSGLPIISVQNDNPGTNSAFLNYSTCAATTMPAGASSGR